MLLTDVLPNVAAELQTLLIAAERAELASQVQGLKIVDRCMCGDNFCASFYTQPKPTGSYGPNHECLELEPAEGMLILDIVNGLIAHVELLNRDDVRKGLATVLP